MPPATAAHHLAPSDPSALPLFATLGQARGRYDSRSPWAFLFVVLIYILISYLERGHLTIHLRLFSDPLLAFTWATMAALLCWDVRPRRDVPLFLVGLVGGFAIEAFGTYCGVWSYSTGEKPPLGIVPCWPVAALAVDRIARLLSPLLARVARPEPVYYACMLAFSAAMASFTRPMWGLPGTQAILLALLWISLRRPVFRADVCLFLGGSLLGLPIEFWGTRRPCWVYYTHQTPAPVAVFAHGFCAVAFSRGVQLLSEGWILLRRRFA